MCATVIESERFTKVCEVAKALDLASRTRLDRIADAPVDVYERAWSVASSEAYRDAIIAWRDQVGWVSRASNSVILAMLVGPLISQADYLALTNGWQLVTKHDVWSTHHMELSEPDTILTITL